jgi:outer membrane protein OmpA-like peptidoglycan-associated protein
MKINMNSFNKIKSTLVAKAIAITALSVLSITGLLAQEQTPVPVSGPVNTGVPEMPKFNRFSLGLKVTHLYDIKSSSMDLLSTGASANDPQGLNGAKTKFDMAAGLEANYFFGPLFSMDLGYEKGIMTGANNLYYYQSDVSFWTLGGNIALKRSLRIKEYKWVPYGRLSLARGTYDAEAKFIADDVSLSKAKGVTMMYGVGLGMRYYINHNWSMFVQSEYVAVNTDAWDGYDYGTGSDQMLKTSLGLKYAFGRNKHVDQTLAWQDNRVDRMQARLDNQVNDAIKNINDSVGKTMAAYMSRPGSKDSDDDGIVDKFDKCPDVAGLFSNNGCPPVEETAQAEEKEKAAEAAVEKSSLAAGAVAGDATAAASGSGKSKGGLNNEEKYRLKNEILVEMYPVRFSYNSYQLNAEAYEHLNTVAVVMRNNPSYNLALKGFTDDVGTADYNKKLAEQRANAVSNYLQSRGIIKSRIRVEAMGKDSPLDDNSSRIGKANNRRVEFILE